MDNTQHANTCGCDCTMCHVGHHRRYRWLTILIGVLLAFWVGMKVGEIKGYMIGGGYGPMMRHHQMVDYREGGMIMEGTMPAPGSTAPAVAPAPVQ